MRLKILIGTVSFVLFGFTSYAQPIIVPKLTWKISYEGKDHLQVFKAPKDKITGIVPIKFKVELQSPLIRILSILNDTKRKIEWVPYLVEAKTIRHNNPLDKIETYLYKLPWPFNKRMYLLHSKTVIYPAEKKTVTKLTSVELPEVPYNPEHVRGFTYFGQFTVQSLTPQKCLLEMILLTDFKGHFPVWLTNYVQSQWPKDMVKKIQKQLAKSDIIIDDLWGD